MMYSYKEPDSFAIKAGHNNEEFFSRQEYSPMLPICLARRKDNPGRGVTIRNTKLQTRYIPFLLFAILALPLALWAGL